MPSQQMIDVVKDVAEIGEVFEAISKADGYMGKIAPLLTLSDELKRMLDIDALALKEEFANMSEKDIDDLKTVFDHNFDLKNDLMEDIIEMGFDVLIELGDAVEEAIALAKKIQKK